MTARRAAIGALVLVMLALLAWLYAVHWKPSESRYPRQGIDVSHHQGAIDWIAVAESDQVDFAYIKATEGGDHRDRRFPENWAGAGSAEISRGAYHFFTLCTPGDVQARNYIATVPKTPLMLPPVIDLEFGGNCEGRPSPDALVVELMIFIRAVEAHYGQQVILYLTREFDAGYAISTRVPRRLWLRGLVWEPKWGARPWTIWQASSFRSVAGIKGRVDWNVIRP
ncbi:GH25 family lysozyme [Sphingomonas sp. G-3-2-10]|uniref:GH25 family lysozyme n=1 Tax=Sphingomonas sp. G-3-2-10 TaxID=2728838 RepID=UPI0019CFD6EB